MELLVSAAWLESQLEEPDLVVLDCTVYLQMGDEGFKSISGRADWQDCRVPNSGFADLLGSLCDPDAGIGYALPAPEVFAAAMAELGVSDNSRVVLYDNNQSMWAARVWWMLRWIGFDNAALLNGGMKSWRAEDRPVHGFADEAPAVTVEPLSVNVRPNLIADKAEVSASIDDGATCLIDALPAPMYSGEMKAYARAGHIPGAVNTAASSLVDPDSGRYRPLDELAAMFPGDREQRIITYCGGGIAASSDAFVLTLLRYNDVAVYTASLQEWVADPDAPLLATPTPEP